MKAPQLFGHRVLISLLAILLPILGCSLTAPASIVPVATGIPSPALSPSVESTSRSSPPELTPVYLDLCTLITGDEASEVLGKEVNVQPTEHNLWCDYRPEFFPYDLDFMRIYAAQGEEAKATLFEGVGLAVVLAGNDQIESTFRTLVENGLEMSVEEFARTASLATVALGYSVEPIGSIGDAAWWTFDSKQGDTRLTVVRGDNYLHIVIGAPEEGAHLDQAVALANLALPRLPLTFVIETQAIEFFGTVEAYATHLPTNPP
ncbi:MAG TPA: hypothetical protein VJ123_02245 [Anaerolineales bacterium]|nr:hypothetical protein [Anaerolineales bacterium]